MFYKAETNAAFNPIIKTLKYCRVMLHLQSLPRLCCRCLSPFCEKLLSLLVVTQLSPNSAWDRRVLHNCPVARFILGLTRGTYLFIFYFFKLWLHLLFLCVTFYRLTTFVMKSFGGARPYIYVQPEHITEAKKWLSSHQKPDGCIASVGKLFHNGMKVNWQF